MAKQKEEEKSRVELFLENIHIFDTYYQPTPVTPYRLHKLSPYNSADMRLWLADGFASTALTPADRQTIFWYYICALTQSEVGDVLGISQRAISERIESSKERWDSVLLRGDRTPARQEPRKAEQRTPTDSPFYEWNQQVTNNGECWWEVPLYIWDLIYDQFGVEVYNYPYQDEVSDVPETKPRLRKEIYINGVLAPTRPIYEVLMENPETLLPDRRKNSVRSGRGESVYDGDDSNNMDWDAQGQWWSPTTGDYSSKPKRRRYIYFHSPEEKNIAYRGKSAAWYKHASPVITYKLSDEELKKLKLL